MYMIRSEDYRNLKAYWDYQRLIEYNREILKDQLSGVNISSVDSFETGQKIRIQSGPFISKKGIINKISYNKVIITLESINLNLVLNRSTVVAA